MAKETKNAEIWLSRVQRELLSMTTTESSSGAAAGLFPPFIRIKEHSLDVSQATCTVAFQVNARETCSVVVLLDTSLPRNADDGLIASDRIAYPFVEPLAFLLEGQDEFPEGSSIRNGDSIDMDIEWTPSLQLVDAIVNIGLKIKESILQDEPFHPAAFKDAAVVPNPLNEMSDAVDEVAKSARRFASSLSQRASNFGKVLSPQNRSKQSPNGSSTSVSPEATWHAKKSKAKSKSSLKMTSPENIKIGDEINLLQEPWVDAVGVYACKAIRRSTFIMDAMALAEEKSEQQSFGSPSAMLRSFSKSARSVLQESFLMITESHVIEMKSSKLNPTTATVTFCISIDLMHKLKFRRGESISLFFKPAPDDPLVYMCPDSGDAVYQIQAVLKRHGVKGKHTNAAAHRAIAEAMQIIQEIQTKEVALKHDPCVERVNEIMDLYRQAAERFAVSGDLRHEEVIMHMRKFLALPKTISILDGSFKKPDPVAKRTGDGIPEGEIIERTQSQLEDDQDDLVLKRKQLTESDKAFEDNVESLLKEAQADLQRLNVDGDYALDTSISDDDGFADVAADLDEMMKNADKELTELLKE